MKNQVQIIPTCTEWQGNDFIREWEEPLKMKWYLFIFYSGVWRSVTYKGKSVVRYASVVSKFIGPQRRKVLLISTLKFLILQSIFFKYKTFLRNWTEDKENPDNLFLILL